MKYLFALSLVSLPTFAFAEFSLSAALTLSDNAIVNFSHFATLADHDAESSFQNSELRKGKDLAGLARLSGFLGARSESVKKALQNGNAQVAKQRFIDLLFSYNQFEKIYYETVASANVAQVFENGKRIRNRLEAEFSKLH